MVYLNDRLAQHIHLATKFAGSNSYLNFMHENSASIKDAADQGDGDPFLLPNEKLILY